MKPTLENLVYFGIGTALLAKEKLEKAQENAKDTVEATEQKAREFFEQAVSKGSAEREDLKKTIKELISEVIGELGLVTKADLEEVLARKQHHNGV